MNATGKRNNFRKKEVDNFMMGSVPRGTDWVKKKQTWLSSHESTVAFFPLHPRKTEKMKARRAAGGLLHHLTPLSSSRIQAQTIQSSAQSGVGPLAVIGCEHMADHTHSTHQPARICFPQYPAQRYAGVRLMKTD